MLSVDVGVDMFAHTAAAGSSMVPLPLSHTVGIAVHPDRRLDRRLHQRHGQIGPINPVLSSAVVEWSVVVDRLVGVLLLVTRCRMKTAQS